MAEDEEMPDADEPFVQSIPASLTERELNEKYPNRPRNKHKTLPFHVLFTTLFNPLNDNKKKPTGPIQARKKQGPHGPTSMTPHEKRRSIVDRFISRWKKEVGHDFFPAMRLILPEKDRERAMYGLKEKAIGKILVRIMKIDKNSEDASTLLNWKLPGLRFTSAMAGDFAGRCFEVLSKRPMRTKVGDMTIAEVNNKLDELSWAQKEEDQLPIMQEFYQRMNPEELKWLIRIILRQMKIGATEKTVLEIWHPDAETLFNISSNLRRVCWELYDSTIRLNQEESDIALMQCFQPQLGQFQMSSFDKMVKKMKPTEDDNVFWIEEKLDGERMQMHMIEDPDTPGGKRFAFWSRKAKEYTYLYGNGLFDDNSALTRHLQEAFHKGVRNIILDGEMITWSMKVDKIVQFGTLKSAAIAMQKNPFAVEEERPLFKVFDILMLNDQPLTGYTLRDRRRALEQSVRQVERRLEIHEYKEATSAEQIEPILREVVAIASEGLVLKNPRSAYRLNERNDDWIKVKPEYMNEFGEELDCLVIGGYYGSGRRGGALSSFLCGLIIDKPGYSQTWSFCKVGGGFMSTDYATIRHQTEGKWKDWDRKNPPTEYIELGGGVQKQYECPDVWIRPDESFVISIKAASVHGTIQFRTGFTLRFPRFKKLRTDRAWNSALTYDGFMELKSNVEQELKEKEFKIDESRKQKRARTNRKKDIVVAGAESASLTAHGSEKVSQLFSGLTFYIMGPAPKPLNKSKADLEAFVKTHGGIITQSTSKDETICIADSNLVPVVSLKKRGYKSIVRPSWLYDCVAQAELDVSGFGKSSTLLIPYEPKHMFFIKDGDQDMLHASVDQWGDSYARDIKDRDEMRAILDAVPSKFDDQSDSFEAESMLEEIDSRGKDFLDESNDVGMLFRGCVVHFAKPGPGGETAELRTDLEVELAKSVLKFASGRISSSLEENALTHVIIPFEDSEETLKVRRYLSTRPKLPRLVTLKWVQSCWEERTRVDEERFVPA